MADNRLFIPNVFHYTTRSTTGRQPIVAEGSIKFQEIENLQTIFDTWAMNQMRPDFDPVPTLIALAELIENAYEEFLKLNPDPLDERHPIRLHPDYPYGHLLRAVFKRDEFINKLVISYLTNRENMDLCIASARFLLTCVPGTGNNTEEIFSEPEDFIPQLFEMAKNSENEILSAYCMGLLSVVMEVQDNASKYRLLNAGLINVALQRLFRLKELMITERQCQNKFNESETSLSAEMTSGPFGDINLHEDTVPKVELNQRQSKDVGPLTHIGLGGSNHPMRKQQKQLRLEGYSSSPPAKKIKKTFSTESLHDLELSNSCWSNLQQYVIGKNKLFPLTIEMHQRLILQFLGPTGEYQDLLSHALEGNSMELVLFYIDLENTRDVRLTFDALRYLTSLLVHRKFALEFVARGGIQQLLKIPRFCMASLGAITCFYYLSYNEEVMEKVCQLNSSVLDDLVDYALWCLQHSYESGMASASMFFTHAFYYKTILQRFDQRNGLRILYNYISTLGILIDPSNYEKLSDEQIQTSVQSVRNASASFRSYISSSLYVKIEHLKRSCKGLSQFLKIATETIAPYKVMDMPEDSMELAVELLTTVLKVSPSGWKAVEKARELGLIETMFNVLEFVQEWNAGVGRNELLHNALEVIWMCSTLPKVREDFCKILNLSSVKHTPFRLLLHIADATIYEEDKIQADALRIIYNCIQNLHYHKGSIRLDIKKVRQFTGELNDIDKKVWNCLRQNNIIMVLNNVIRQTVPAPEADRLRDLSCKCMLGMARCEEVRQILSKLPLIANNELQAFMKLPVAQDKKTEHSKFCRAAKDLIEIVTQKPINDKIPDPKDLTQERLWKSYVVANTHITFNEKELLQLIHGHLLNKGLVRTATELIKEAELPDVPASSILTPAKLQPMPSVQLNVEPTGLTAGTSTVSLYSSTVTPRTPLPKTPINKRLLLKTPTHNRTPSVSSTQRRIQPFKGLGDIVTDYFRQQHSNCSNPVTTCPPFSLFFPHQCPEPRSFGSIPYNIVKRFEERTIRRLHEKQRSLFQDEKYVFSRFRLTKNFSDQDEMYTCCAFSVDDEHLIVGMFTGDIFWINLETGNEDSHTTAHVNSVSSIEPAKDGSLLLTSSAFLRPVSTVWKLRETQEYAYDLPDQYRVKFANNTQDRMVGTHETGKATVFDTETSHALCIYQWESEALSARYRYNVASFSPYDNTIFSDGILWDVRDSVKPIHIFDKLNPLNAGVFHPHGNEIVINSEVWDMRTFRLLHNVPALDSCNVNFNSTGNVIYATAHVEDDVCKQYGSYFRTFDSKDYSVITTVDVKRNILDIDCSHGDQFMAVIERRPNNPEYYLDPEQSNVRLYEIGKKREAEDDLDEGEEDNDQDNDHHDNDSDNLSMTSDSLDGEDIGIFESLRELDSDTSETESLTDEEEEDDDESEGWETASSFEENDDNDHDDNGDGGNNGISSSDSDDDDIGGILPEFRASDDVDHHSTSVVALNPQMRQKRQ